jgi:hypothetical protein
MSRVVRIKRGKPISIDEAADKIVNFGATHEPATPNSAPWYRSQLKTLVKQLDGYSAEDLELVHAELREAYEALEPVPITIDNILAEEEA